MTNAPVVDIDMADFWADPYPTLKRLRAEAPVARVPQLGGVVLTRRDDISVCEKQVEYFSSHQPQGLMNVLMGHNLMRKDGEAHQGERAALFPAVSPKTVKTVWTGQFHGFANRILDGLAPKGAGDLVKAYALPLSGEALKAITGLTQIAYQEMDAWSQAMIDGIANYVGDPEVERRCHAATAAIDRAIDEQVPVLVAKPDHSILSVLMRSGMAMESIRANVKLAISGGQNEPRDAIAGTIWALLTHPDQLALALDGKVSWRQVFEEYARWISPIGMSPRRMAKRYEIRGITLEPEDRVFLMFGSANRDEDHFERAEAFDVTRNVQGSIPFGAGPHFCAGAFASRALVAEVALPTVFARLKNLRLDETEPVRIGGWAFRGILNLPCQWDR